LTFRKYCRPRSCSTFSTGLLATIDTVVQFLPPLFCEAVRSRRREEQLDDLEGSWITTTGLIASFGEDTRQEDRVTSIEGHLS
jgi:hypothetical protein